MSFIRSIEKSYDEASKRQNGREGLLKFGISYLDDAMVGILKNDLILIGAGSGAGKTQTCCNIAKANVEQGKRVHYIALEAEFLEIERRIKYQIFAREFFADPKRPKISISFQNWMLGDYMKSCVAYEAIAANEFIKRFDGLFTFYKNEKFDINDMILKITECADDTDLIILDHVHYMDFDDDNENKSVKNIAKTARTLALEMGKPIILVSHMRKSDRHSRTFAPGLEEFHGSSDLYKIATKAITIGPGAMIDNKIETYFRIVKNRFEGSVTRYIGKSYYNSQQGKYERTYEIGDAQQSWDNGFHQLTRDIYPEWAEYSAPISSGTFAPYGSTTGGHKYPGRKNAFSVTKKED